MPLQLVFRGLLSVRPSPSVLFTQTTAQGRVTFCVGVASERVLKTNDLEIQMSKHFYFPSQLRDWIWHGLDTVSGCSDSLTSKNWWFASLARFGGCFPWNSSCRLGFLPGLVDPYGL